ncbi:unnamed protein product [Cyprideis torosa]|uniref:GTPase Era, mitochondrial n=1 Tax=Cyprideis torosa TaxID=163714 RepID=A0A7R8WJB9_9CRUS|nr:unnamed protein product [Cyprideis torosa]CAG0901791.1 unnamed protein product [Cyprideis torosa]
MKNEYSPDHRAGYVNIIGRPNAGKSTLINGLMKEKLAIVSPKAQTTRHRILGILNEQDYQLILSDTPGMIDPAYKLQERMMTKVKEAFEDADVSDDGSSGSAGGSTGSNSALEEENSKLETLMPSAKSRASLSGVVVDQNDMPVSGAEVTIGDQSMSTDNQGAFLFVDVDLLTDYTLIKVTKDGFMDGFKTIRVSPSVLNNISLKLVSQPTAKTLDTSNGGQIQTDEVTLSFPASSLMDEDKEAYTGQANLYIHYYDPSEEETYETMPGDLAGINEANDFVALETYGMLSVDLRDENGNPLQIMDGKTVEGLIPIDKHITEE